MTEQRPYCTLAFVSGKGGVGKTTLVSNTAWLLSRAPAKVLIIDLDFQNFGCSSLFGARHQLKGSDALTLLRDAHDRSEGVIHLTHITENLDFLPAALRATEDERRDAFLNAPDNLCHRLTRLLADLQQRFSIDCFILDCHGGIDATSIAAAGISTHTLVITEADTVSFGGTLGLIDAYYDQYGASEPLPKIEYVVNRIPPKYRFDELNALYLDLLSRQLGQLTVSKSILCYIPDESYLAETFGAYPFQVELAQSSLFAHKVATMLYDLLHEGYSHLLSSDIVKRYGRSRYRLKIRRRLISSRNRNIRTVFASYAWASLYFILAFVAQTAAIFAAAVSGWDREWEKMIPIVTWGVGLAGIPVGLYFVYGLFRISAYFREHLSFEKGMLRVWKGEGRRWQRVIVWKTRILFYSALVGPVVFVLLTLWLLLGIVFFLLY